MLRNGESKWAVFVLQDGVLIQAYGNSTGYESWSVCEHIVESLQSDRPFYMCAGTPGRWAQTMLIAPVAKELAEWIVSKQSQQMF